MQLPAAVRIKSWLKLATDRSVLQLVPVMGIVVNTTFMHVVTSVDLGFANLVVRIPLAATSVLPIFGLIYLAHKIVGEHPSLQVPLVFSAYLSGGALRGLILEQSLIYFEILEDTAANFRILSGIVVVTISASVVSYVWAITVKARSQLQELRTKTESLQKALAQLQSASVEKQLNFTLSFADRIKDQLQRIGSADHRFQHEELDNLIRNVIKPLSKEFAQDINRYQVAPIELKATIRDIWFSINPIKHLPAPALAAILISVGGSASLVGIFGIRNAIELMLLSTITLAICLVLGYAVAKQILTNLVPPIRDVVIFLGFLILAIPPSYVTRFALLDTENPDAYVVPGIIMLPIFGWLIMTGNAGWQRLKDITTELNQVQNQLQWSIARLNLLAWYYNGVASRLLHGPIQNSAQVAALKLEKISDPAAKHQILEDLITRIDAAIKQAVSDSEDGDVELLTLSEVVSTWRGIANVELAIAPNCQQALMKDRAGASIVVDLIQEYCSNVIRHAGVKNLAISLQLVGDAVEIEIWKDISNLKPEIGAPGLGNEFISAVTISSQRSEWGEKAQLKALVPINLRESGTGL